MSGEREDEAADAGRGQETWSREALGERFADWPLLRLLVFTFWFRVVLLGLLAAGLTAGVLLWRGWRTTPEGVTPGVRISLLDALQAWNAKRLARDLTAKDAMAAAFKKWAVAVANNPGDPEALRGQLGSVGFVDQPEHHALAMANAGVWLLRLGQTNAADLELVTGAWVLCGLGPRAVLLLDPYRSQLSPEAASIYWMGLLQNDRAEAYVGRGGFPPEVPTDDAERAATPGLAAMRRRLAAAMVLHRAAYRAGWGAEPGRAEALRQLRLAQGERESERMAYDLELLVHRHGRDADAAAALLRRMDEIGRLEHRHQIAYWDLLLSEGRREEVKRALGETAVRPESLLDAYALSRTCARVGLFDKAVELIGRYPRNLPWFTEVVTLHAEVLAGARDWPALLDLAIRIRMHPDATAALSGYSHCLSALAETRMNRNEFAQSSLAALERVGIADPELAVKVADNLLEIGQPEVAERLLLAHRTAVFSDPRAVGLLLRCADHLKHEDRLIEAAGVFRQLRPHDPVAASDLATALLVQRSRPDEAIRLTLEAMLAFPGNPRAVLNHADALVFNDRLPEADAELGRVVVARLSANDVAQYRLVEAELRWKQGRLAEALAAGRAVETQRLFPSQKKRLETMLDRVRAELERRPA
jgi:tetratricopeptide (TPR) repeat protein